MNTSVNWKGGLSFEGTAESGFEIKLGSGQKLGGPFDGFRPMELIAIGMAGCTGMDVISIMLKKRQDVTDFSVAVKTERAERHPKVFTKIHIHYTFTGNNIDPRSAERSIDLSQGTYCPAVGMLSQVTELTHSYEIIAAA